MSRQCESEMTTATINITFPPKAKLKEGSHYTEDRVNHRRRSLIYNDAGSISALSAQLSAQLSAVKEQRDTYLNQRNEAESTINALKADLSQSYDSHDASVDMLIKER